VRYVIAKPRLVSIPKKLPEPEASEMKRLQQERRAPQQAYMAELDARDPSMPYLDRDDYKQRMRARMSLRALHGGG
jgi:hypothetical protein